MFKNKLVISKQQYEIVKGFTKYSSVTEFDVCYSIIEFGVAFLLCLSFERNPPEENNATIQSLIDMWNAEKSSKQFSDSMNEFMSLDDRKKYLNNRDLFSFLGINAISVTPEQKKSVQNASVYSGTSERECSHYTFEAGMMLFILASETNETIKGTTNIWMSDKSIMRIADAYRKSWEVGGETYKAMHKND